MALFGHDLINVLTWWAYLFAMGVLVLPVTAHLFARFLDVGYAFSKVIGIGTVSYLVWLTSSLHVLPFSRTSIAVCVFLVAIVVYGKRTRREQLSTLVRTHTRVFVLTESVFLLVLTLWAYFRGLRPEILGLEKFMDFGFAASIARSEYMPPPDMWFAGETINYYYFGHFVFTLLSKLSGIQLAVAYNIMAASLAALCFSLTLSLTANLIHACKSTSVRSAVVGGCMSAVLITFGGNLHPAVYAYTLPLLKTIGLYDTTSVARYWYSDATRYVGYDPPTDDKTIHEFPFYSFVVSDLHAHVLNLPFVLTILALLSSFFLTPTPPQRPRAIARFIDAAPYVVGGGLMLAIVQMTNPWDLPIYGFIALTLWFVRNALSGSPLRRAVLETGAGFASTLIVAWIFAAPFVIHFQNHYGQIGLVQQTTALHQLLVLWVVPLILVSIYLASLSFATARQTAETKQPTLWRRLIRAATRLERADLLVVILTVSALGLVLLPELIYVRDIYTVRYYRANTFFKLSYQAFVLFCVLLGYYFVRILEFAPTPASRRILKPLCLFVLALPLLYTSFGIRGYYGRLHPFHYKGLDGLAFLERYRPGDGEAVRWLDANVRGTPNILEANGNSYTDFGRVSMATGLPTVLGWNVHEWLWRGGREEVDQRAQEIAAVYESDDEGSTLEILRRYDVELVILGDLERNKFPRLNEDKLLALGEIVFEAKGTTILRVRPEP